jgi:hypothetical protein
MRFIALTIFSLMIIAPASAQYAALRPKGAVPLLDGCNGMSGYPDCHPYRIYEGRSVIGPVYTPYVYHPGIGFYYAPYSR